MDSEEVRRLRRERFMNRVKAEPQKKDEESHEQRVKAIDEFKLQKERDSHKVRYR